MSIRMAAPYERIFALAAEIERWPELLPHYRYVRPLPAAAGERHFAMGARRGPVPVRWSAVQRPLPDARRIEFRHTGGVTRGMEVEWRFQPAGEGRWDVSIHHALTLRWPVVGELVARHLIGPHFLDAIAGRTLRRIRDLAEAAA
jgi:ribosome-associated toxin RatA of RatAB toxin-antitoxin module